MLKKIVKKAVFGSIDSILNTTFGGFITERCIASFNNKYQDISYGGTELKFYSPNRINKFRVQRFATKEPETLDWIDSFEEKSVFWDIGANVGIFSIYAAKKKACNVVAFEPSVFNLEALARNIFINDLVDIVSIFPLPLFNHAGAELLRMTSTEWGGAISSFGTDKGFDGNPVKTVFQYSIFGTRLDEAA
jgi:FkbM family methyltransferase